MTVRRRIALLAVVIGPGLLAGLSDDDPAGITTYSVLGAKHGYRLLWVLLLSTVALVLFHDLGARMGIVTGQGLTGLVREAYGVRRASIAVVTLVVANVGTTCAEFAGSPQGWSCSASLATSACRSRPSRCRSSCSAARSTASNVCCSC